MADVADGVMLSDLTQKLNHEAYNLASEVGQTLRDFAAAVRAALPDADISIGSDENPTARSSIFRGRNWSRGSH